MCGAHIPNSKGWVMLAGLDARNRLAYQLDEVAGMVGKHARTLKRWAEQGTFPKPFKQGGCLFVLADDLTAWVDEQRRGK